jgi:hypothetical protein
MLRQVFGLSSHSIYDDQSDIGAVSAVREAVGHRFLGEPWPRFYRRAQGSETLTPVKTHGAPLDTGRAIYVVRDGRAAIVSWYNLLIRLRRRRDVTIADVIDGRKVVFGDWSAHLHAWRPWERPDTLLLRYEELNAEPDVAIARIGRFLGVAPVRAWENEFGRLHTVFPEFFAGGSNERNIAQMSEADHRRFWDRHGAMMARLCYSR